MTRDTPDKLRARLNTETARITWNELAPHFARGMLVTVDAGLDLVDVAAAFVENRLDAVDAWVESGQVARSDDDDARRWAKSDALLWAVVVAPWVLVQESNREPGNAE